MKKKPMTHKDTGALPWLSGCFSLNHSHSTCCGIRVWEDRVRKGWRHVTCKNCLRTKNIGANDEY